MYGKLHVKYAYAPELNPAMNSPFGFMLPEREIRRSSLEFMDGFLGAVLAMK